MEIPIVWIIDNDMICRFASNYKFEQSLKNYEVIGHSSAFEGLTSLEECLHGTKKLPDIILLDLQMPGMDGWSFLKELEKMGAPVKKIHVYILSAFTNSRDFTLAKKHPLIKGFFSKPLSEANVRHMFSGIEVETLPETLS